MKKKLRTYLIPVPVLCTALAANCLLLTLGSALNVFAMGTPGGLPHSQIVDPPKFKQDSTNGCQGSPSDFDTKPRTDPNFMSSKAHYRVLTINKGGGRCDHLSWDIHKTVPKAAITLCVFFMHLRGTDSPTGINLKFLNNRNNPIVPEKNQGAPGPFRATVQGVHVVQADFVGVDPGTKVDIGILFVDCTSTDPAFRNPSS